MQGLRTGRRLKKRPLGRLEVLESRLLMAFNPSGAEQEMLEHVNRMRMDPQGELNVLFSSLSPLVARDADANSSIRYFNDPTAAEIAAEWPALTAVAPLAWNESLYNVSAAHNAAMIAADTQSHQTPGEPSFATRFTNAGYTSYSYISENIFAYAHSTFEAHSGFAIDWAVSDRGHRDNLMSAGIREAGIGITAESNPGTSVGPVVVSQDFGNRFNLGNSYLLGVAYQDGDGNGRYTAGEGLGGVRITVSGPAGTFSTTSMTAGGYQLEVPAGTYTVTASGGGLSAPVVRTGVAVGSANVKVDFLPSASTARPVTVGLYDPASSTFYLRNSNGEGMADSVFGYGAAGAGWKPVAGDWNGDGRTTIGLYATDTSYFHLRNSNTTGMSDYSFGYGAPSMGSRYILMMGDWNGDGVDTVGLFDRAASQWYLRNSNTTGIADVSFGYGAAGSTWTPLVGDWNGDGIDTIGFYDTVNAIYYLRNSNSMGFADYAFGYGVPGSTWTPIMGDWDDNGTATIGFYDQASGHWYLRNSNDQGMADVHFGFGAAGQSWQPIVGKWLGAAGAALLAAEGSGQMAVGSGSASLAPNPSSLAPLIDAAIARWSAIGATDEQLARLRQVEVTLADLPDARLGEARDGLIVLDRDAAGQGWFIDPTPYADEEFLLRAGQLQAVDAQAVDRIDLLTVIAHELGHIAGLPDLDAAAGSLMSGQLPVGVRRMAG